MLKRVIHLSVTCLLLPLWGCAGAADDGSSFGTFGTSFTGQTTVADDMDDMDMDETSAGDGDGGDGDGDTGDGDGDTGDGDGDTGDGDGDTGDGDGDTGDGDGAPGDGDGEPGPNCGNGVINPGETCDGTNFGGVTCVDLGFDQGVLTCNSCAVSTASCSNAPQPGLGQLYSHCLDASGCPNLDGCATVSMEGDPNPFDGFCTNFCSSDAECFANVGGSAVPRCNDEPDRYCELDCASGKTCPGGMVCTSLVGGKQLCY